MLKYGFIGLGNMSTAIIKGMLASNKFLPKQIIGLNRSKHKTEKLVEELQITGVESIEQLVTQVDVIVLGVKPQNLDEILPKLKVGLSSHQIVISIAAGKDLAYLEGKIASTSAVFRVMPNINAIVGASTSCYATHSSSDEQKQIVEEIFSSIGTIMELPEKHFSTFTTIACASPAFSYMYIDALARAAVQEGLPKKLALEIAASSVLGSAKMILESGNHPWELVDQVCSPGGTTIRGVTSLQQNGFESAVQQAVFAVSARDAELK